MNMTFHKLYNNALTGLWFIPVLCVLIGIGISFATIAVDRSQDYQLIPRGLVGGPDAATAILQTTAASMVSLTALVLTVTMVVVQLSMGQFSPRIVQRILQDKPSQLAIGLFVATFVHAILAVREVTPDDAGQENGTVPGVAVVTAFLLVLTSVAVLVMYVHHVGQALRVAALVELVGSQTRRLLDDQYPDKGDGASSTEVDSGSVVVARKSGVITMIGHQTLVEQASSANCVLELVPGLGSFVPAGATLFKVHGNGESLDRRAVLKGVLQGLERTLEQDVGYGLRMLVDIAERSVSDSPFQDPTTAVQAIDRLHDCMRQLVRRPLHDGRHRDEEGEVRLIEPAMTWDDYVHLAFDEVRLAGAGSPQVSRRLHAALEDLIAMAPPERVAVLAEQRDMLEGLTRERFSDKRDVQRASRPDPQGLG